jgi:hypothetical protein
MWYGKRGVKRKGKQGQICSLPAQPDDVATRTSDGEGPGLMTAASWETETAPAPVVNLRLETEVSGGKDSGSVCDGGKD